jgi:hypothetical protein
VDTWDGIKKTDKILKCCLTCKHFDIEAHKCPAFPTGVPFQYLDGAAEHSSPVNGYAFEMIPEEKGMKRLLNFYCKKDGTP